MNHTAERLNYSIPSYDVDATAISRQLYKNPITAQRRLSWRVPERESSLALVAVDISENAPLKVHTLVCPEAQSTNVFDNMILLCDIHHAAAAYEDYSGIFVLKHSRPVLFELSMSLQNLPRHFPKIQFDEHEFFEYEEHDE